VKPEGLRLLNFGRITLFRINKALNRLSLVLKFEWKFVSGIVFGIESRAGLQNMRALHSRIQTMAKQSFRRRRIQNFIGNRYKFNCTFCSSFPATYIK
jgi:hypothetical protein